MFAQVPDRSESRPFADGFRQASSQGLRGLSPIGKLPPCTSPADVRHAALNNFIQCAESHVHAKTWAVKNRSIRSPNIQYTEAVGCVHVRTLRAQNPFVFRSTRRSRISLCSNSFIDTNCHKRREWKNCPGRTAFPYNEHRTVQHKSTSHGMRSSTAVRKSWG